MAIVLSSASGGTGGRFILETTGAAADAPGAFSACGRGGAGSARTVCDEAGGVSGRGAGSTRGGPGGGTADARYAVLTASFPIADVLRKGSAAAARFEAVVGELRSLGYDVRSMDVNLQERGEWRRVLVGEFATLSDAKAEAHRVHQTPSFAYAQVVSY